MYEFMYDVVLIQLFGFDLKGQVWDENQHLQIREHGPQLGKSEMPSPLPQQ